MSDNLGPSSDQLVLLIVHPSFVVPAGLPIQAVDVADGPFGLMRQVADLLDQPEGRSVLRLPQTMLAQVRALTDVFPFRLMVLTHPDSPPDMSWSMATISLTKTPTTELSVPGPVVDQHSKQPTLRRNFKPEDPAALEGGKPNLDDLVD